MSTLDRLRWSDYFLLAAFCALLCSFPLWNNRVLTTHETVHCQNAREMLAGGDWIIPHYGGRPWVERPPLPFWITIGLVELFGDTPFSYRLAALLMGIPCVLMVAWMAGLWYGRGIGIASGLILATMQEFTHYATGPEADIFLCTIVTAAIALFVHLEFQCRPADPAESTDWLGWRSWPVLAFFAVLGLTNLAKGLFFGTLFVLLPVLGFLLGKLDWPALRRYLWLWGWLAFLVVAAAWPVAALVRYPDILDFWKSDYLGRVNQGYMREPFWYYFAQLPLVVFPWTLPGFVGLWLMRWPALREKNSPERFLWLWALAPILFFSLPQGKHHHYLLQCMAPWAVLAALGSVYLWRMTREAPWLAKPWPSLLALGLPGCLAIALFWSKIPGPNWLVAAFFIGWPLCVLALWWAVVQPSSRAALGGLCTLLLAIYWLTYAYRTSCWDRYEWDSTLVRQACAQTPSDKPLLVMDDDAPLNASWLLFYLGDRATLLHNLTFLAEERLKEPEVFLIARFKVAKSLASFGTYEVLQQSQHSRYETTPDDRYTLFRLRFHDHLVRQPAPRISPMQATGRAAGPYLVDLRKEPHPQGQHMIHINVPSE